MQLNAPVAIGGTASVHVAGDCVMKVAQQPTASAAARLAAEAAILERLGSPWAPALLARTVAGDGRAALVMERIDGVELSTWCATAAAERRLEAAGRFVERVAGIHTRGVVHGDLSGRNVLVGDDDVRIVDFGSARVIGEGASGASGSRLATPAYLAPAVAGVAAPALTDDVYAAGVVLYELLTGRLPFDGGAGALRQAHATRRPPMLSASIAVGRAVERVVLRCLAKEPARRYRDGGALCDAWKAAVAATVAAPAPRLARGTSPHPRVPASATVADEGAQHAVLLGFRHAGDVAAVHRLVEDGGGRIAHLDAGVGVAAWTRGVAPDHAAAFAARQLRAHGCADFVEERAVVRVDVRGVIRSGVVARLAARVARTHDAVPVGAAVPLVGRARELAVLTEAVQRDAVLVTIEGDAGAGKSRLVDELVASVAGVRATPAEALVRITGAVGHPEESLRQLTAWLGDDDRPRERTPAGSRAGVVAALAERLLARAEGAGLVVVLDDVQWMDAVILDAAALAVGRAGERAIAVIAAARPGCLETPAVRTLGAARVAVRLAPLDLAAAVTLCRTLLADVVAVPAALLDRLARHAGGLPLVIHELVRAIRAAGGIRDGRLHADVVRPPAGVAMIEWAVERELARLDPDLRGHAFVFAVLGDGVDAGTLARVLEQLDRADAAALAPLDARAAIERLRAAGLVHERDGKAELRHALVRDAILRRVPDATTRIVAAAACDALRGLATTAAFAEWTELAARHEEAVTAWHAVGDAALARFDHAGAEHAYERALALADRDDHRRCELHARRAVARYRLGRHAAAADDFAAARAYETSPSRRARLLLDEAMALDWARDFDLAARRAAEADRLLDAGVPAALDAARALAVGRTSWRAGDVATARIHLERARALAAQLDDDDGHEVAVVSGVVLGWVLAELGELAEAEAVVAAAGARANARGDRLHEAAALNNLAFVRWRRGTVGDLAAVHRRVVTLGRELGMPSHEYRAERWMFEVSLAAGACDEARRHAERLVALEAAFPELFAPGPGQLARARAAVCAGDLATAAAYVAGADFTACAGGHRLIGEAIARAARGDGSYAAWCAAMADACAAADPDAAVEIARLGIAAGVPLDRELDHVLTTAGVAPAMRKEGRP